MIKMIKEKLLPLIKKDSFVKNLIVSIIIFLIIWYVVSKSINNLLLPAPTEVFFALIEGLFFTGEIIPHIFASIKRALAGFILALLLSSSLAYLLGFSTTLKKYVTPIIELARPIPPLAWIPLAILWFGIGDFSSIFIIFIAAFFPLFTEVSFGIISIPTVYKKLIKSAKLSKSQEFVHIIFPFTLPYLFSGIKTSLGLSWMALIAAEIIAAREGLGYLIETSRVLLQTDEVIASMIIIGVIGYLMHQGVILIEKKVTHWRY